MLKANNPEKIHITRSWTAERGSLSNTAWSTNIMCTNETRNRNMIIIQKETCHGKRTIGTLDERAKGQNFGPIVTPWVEHQRRVSATWQNGSALSGGRTTLVRYIGRSHECTRNLSPFRHQVMESFAGDAKGSSNSKSTIKANTCQQYPRDAWCCTIMPESANSYNEIV